MQHEAVEFLVDSYYWYTAKLCDNWSR